MENENQRTSALRGIRLVALWVGIAAVTLQIMSQVLTVPTGFGIEDYLGWVGVDRKHGPEDQLLIEWNRFGVGWVAIAYLVFDTALFVPLYCALLVAVTDKFMLAVGKDRALGLKSKDILDNRNWVRRWSSRLVGILMFLIGIDLIENIFGLVRLNSGWWAFGSLIGLISVVSMSTFKFPRWWKEILDYMRWLEWPSVAWTVVVLATLSCLSLGFWKEIQFSPVVWAHHIKVSLIPEQDVGLVHFYSIALVALAAAWFFGLFFDAKQAQIERSASEKQKGDDKSKTSQPVTNGYEQRAAFRRAVGNVILRSRYVLFALVVFIGLALVMNQGRDVLYSVASYELGWSSILVLALSALGMSAFSFACWLWSRSVCLIRSPDTPKSMCPVENGPARLSDRFAKDWARFLGLMPAVLFLLLCGATMRDAIWAENPVPVWILGFFSALATGFCLGFVFLHWRDKEEHFYNIQTFDEWHADTHKRKNEEGEYGKYKFLWLISPFWLPFFAAVLFFLSRSIPMIGSAPSTLISSMLFALTFWLSIFGWISLNEERIALPWVAVLIVVAGAFGYFGWTQNHVVGPVANATSEVVWVFLPVVLAALLLGLFAVFVAFNSTDHFEGLRKAISSVGLVNSQGVSGLSFGRGAWFVFIVVLAALSVLWIGDRLSTPGDTPVPKPNLAKRHGLYVALNKWLSNLYDHRSEYLPKDAKDGPLHVYFVSAEGGGIRAAYWTAIVLDRLRYDPTFASRTFSYSGVSGGSVGMAVDRACQIAAADEPTMLGECIAKLGNADLLSSLVSGWLFEDVVAQIFPTSQCTQPGCGFLSRGVLFERSLLNAVPNMDLGIFSSREKLFRNSDKTHEPYLFLNSTWVESGDRAIASEVNVQPKIDNAIPDSAIAFPRVHDQINILRNDISLAMAAHNSARFPFVNAIGAVKSEECPLKSDKGNLCGHLADGGYFDNSGGHTTQDILRALARCLAPERPLQECAGLEREKTTWLAKNLVPQVIMIRNGVDENMQRTTNCRKRYPPTAEDVRQKEYDPSSNKPSVAGCKGELKLYVDQFGPLVTAINTTGIGANGKLAEANLSREVESACSSFGGTENN